MIDKNKFLTAVIIGIGVFIVLAIYADASKVIISFSNFQWVYIPLILFFVFLNYFLRFLKWNYYLKSIDIKIKIKDSLIIFFSGLAFSATPAKFGEVFKSYLLKRLNNTRISKSAPVIFAERLTDIIALLILSVIGSSVFDYGREAILIMVVSIIVLMLFIRSKRVCSYLEKVRFFSRFANNIRVLYKNAHILLNFKNLLIAVFISVISWSFECLALLYVLKGFDIDISLLASVFTFSFSTIVGVLSMIPGGLGITEGSITGLLQLLGTPKAIAVSSTFVIRFCTLWFGSLIGMIILFLRRQ